MEKKRIVIKLGSSSIITGTGRVKRACVNQLAAQVRLLQKAGYDVVLVVSGAVACGKLPIGAGMQTMMATHGARTNQVAAGIGQIRLIGALYDSFRKQKLQVAQLLLTQNDVADEGKRQTLLETFEHAFTQDVIIIANENDIVQLNNFGGNDYLAAQLARCIEADYLLLLTDVDGVYDRQMKLIPVMEGAQHQIGDMHSTKSLGTGSIQTKIQAAQQAARHDIRTFITSMETKDVLVRLVLEQEHIGTLVI